MGSTTIVCPLSPLDPAVHGAPLKIQSSVTPRGGLNAKILVGWRRTSTLWKALQKLRGEVEDLIPSAKFCFSPKKARLGPQTLTFVSRSGPPFTKRRTEPEFGKHARLTFDQLDKIRPLGPVAPDLVQYWLALGGSGGVRVQCA